MTEASPRVRNGLRRVGLLLALVVVVDLVAAGVVALVRRDASPLPDFARADVTSVQWDVAPYAGRAAVVARAVNPEIVEDPARFADDLVAGRVVSPAERALLVLVAADRFEASGRTLWREVAERTLAGVLDDAVDGAVPNQLDDTDPYGDALPSPGYSAVSQGLVLSALARLHGLTGEQRWRDEADAVFGNLSRFRRYLVGSQPAPEPWFGIVDDDGHLWFESFTNARAPVKVVPAHLLATLGVYDYRRALADEPGETTTATQLFAGALATVVDVSPQVRRPGRTAVSSIAAGTSSQSGHDLLEALLPIIGGIAAREDLRTVARGLRRDDDLPSFEQDRVDLVAGVPVYEDPAPVLGLTTDPDAPALVDPQGRVTFRDGKVHPGVSASYALGALDRFRASGDEQWLRRAETAVEHASSTAPGALLPYRFEDSDVFGATLAPPWYSAEGQGLMLSAATNLATVTGEQKWRDLATELFWTLTRFRDSGPDGTEPPRPWISLVDDSGFVWFEQFPSGQPPSLVFRIHLSTLLAVYEYWDLTRDPLARSLFAGGLATVKRYVPESLDDGTLPDSYAVPAAGSRVQPVVAAQLRLLSSVTEGRVVDRLAGRVAAGVAGGD